MRLLGRKEEKKDLRDIRETGSSLLSWAAQQHTNAGKVKIVKFVHDPSDLFDPGEGKPIEEGPGIAQQEKIRYTLPIPAIIKRDLSQ